MNRKAFSVIELIIVLCIIGILVALLFPAVKQIRDYHNAVVVDIDVPSVEPNDMVEGDHFWAFVDNFVVTKNKQLYIKKCKKVFPNFSKNGILLYRDNGFGVIIPKRHNNKLDNRRNSKKLPDHGTSQVKHDR